MNQAKRLTNKFAREAVTLTELLVVLVIIGILATIAVPVYINHAERARVASAEQEVKEIAMAEDACGAVHNLYVPIQVLDDVPGIESQNGVSSSADAIGSENSIFAVDFNRPLTLLGVNQQEIIQSSQNTQIRNMVEDWQGPFLNPQRVYDATADRYDQNFIDVPLDPWGNPYRFYTPAGITGTKDTDGSYNISDFNGIIGTNDGRFDRYAIVSWGPDGQEDPQGTTIDNDDVVYKFGLTRETNFTFTP